jgi:cytochrome c553
MITMSTRTVVLFAAIALLLAACTAPLGAEDAATLYKSKCATCHAPDGSGRKMFKGSNLLADEVKKRSDAQLNESIAKGGAKRSEGHAYEKQGLSEEQIKLLVAHIRGLQKQSGR